MQHVHNGKAGIQPNEIGQFQRPHRVVRPELERVINARHRANALIKRINRLVDHRHQNAVHDEGGEVFGAGCGFAEPFHNSGQRFIGFLIGGDAANKLDQLHDRHGVHEVEPHEAFGPIGGRSQPCDGNRRGVGGQDRIFAQMRCKACKNLLLDRLFLGRGLDDQITGANRGNFRRGVDIGQGRGLCRRIGLALGDLTVEIIADLRNRTFDRAGGDIVQAHLVSGLRHDMGNAAAHLACANNPNRFDVHASFLFVWPRICAAAQALQPLFAKRKAPPAAGLSKCCICA